ncbi:hypothetical protein [Thalassoroseus pseudoceratinae]|uniref:hypothetical protein n=1 Tax=Thalassoroseus pseudoceratinae TaxID=2713176 RepID=UPI001420D8A5|nr:hypothetical protein [Thalassoroseus pseudoceratinae]
MPIFRCLLILFWLVIGPSRSWADDAASSTPAKPSPPKKSASAEPLTTPTSVGEHYILMRGPKGQLVPVPADVELREFLEWKRNRPQEDAEPEFSIVDMILDGTSNDDRATLSAKMTIKVFPKDRWVRVPLALGEAVIRSGVHRFGENAGSTDEEADEVAGFSGYDARNGYHWWFRGSGLHTLEMKMLVPIRRQGTARQLELTLPTVAASRMSLTLPVASNRIAIPESVGRVIETKSVDFRSTVVDVFGLEKDLDFSWQILPNPKQVRTVLQAETSLRVEPSEEAVLLRGRQFIEPLQGSFQTFEVTLPDGFELSLVKVNGERYQAAPSKNRNVKVELPEATTEPVQLDWILQSPLNGKSEITISDFKVENALRQTGEISVAAYGGYRVVKKSGLDVHRVSISPATDGVELVSAYRFWKQPFRLELELQQIEPAFSVRPLMLLDISSKKVRFHADFEVEVFRGVVDELTLSWPKLSEQEWQIDPTDLPGEVEQFEVDADNNQVILKLAKTLVAGSRLSLPISAIRTLSDEQTTGTPLTLPRFAARYQGRPLLILAERDLVEANLKPTAETALQSISMLPPQADRAKWLELIFEPMRHRFFQIRSDDAEFQLQVVKHSASTTVEQNVSVNVDRESLELTQRNEFRIPFARLSSLEFRLPIGYPIDAFRFSVAGAEAKAEWDEDVTRGERIGRLQFPMQMDDFNVTVRYQQDLFVDATGSALRQTTAPIPYFTNVDATDVAIELNSTLPVKLKVDEAIDLKKTGLKSSRIWQLSGQPREVVLDFATGDTVQSHALRIERLLMESEVGADGTILSRMTAELLEEPQIAWRLKFSGDVRVGRILWDGEPLPSVSPNIDVAADEGIVVDTVALKASESSVPSDRHLLTVEYESTTNSLHRWGADLEIVSPEFSESVWVGQSAWVVNLPPTTSLLQPPEQYTAGYHWTRRGVIWSRESRPEWESPREWITGEANEKEAGTENQYVLTRIGVIEPLRITVLSQSLTVLIGAGVALVIGFLFMQIRAIRNMLTLLLLLLVVAVASVWFPGPVALFLQPVILGLFLAGLAGLIDFWSRQRRQPAVLTLQSPSGYSPVSGVVSPRPMPPLGSEDPTAIRVGPVPQQGPMEEAPRKTPPQRVAPESQPESGIVASSKPS